MANPSFRSAGNAGGYKCHQHNATPRTPNATEFRARRPGTWPFEGPGVARPGPAMSQRGACRSLGRLRLRLVSAPAPPRAGTASRSGVAAPPAKPSPVHPTKAPPMGHGCGSFGVRLLSQEGSRVRAGGFPHLGELTGLYDDNPPSCDNAPPGTRKPSTARTTTLPDTATLLPEHDNPPGHGTTRLAHRERATPMGHCWRYCALVGTLLGLPGARRRLPGAPRTARSAVTKPERRPPGPDPRRQ